MSLQSSFTSIISSLCIIIVSIFVYFYLYYRSKSINLDRVLEKHDLYIISNSEHRGLEKIICSIFKSNKIINFGNIVHMMFKNKRVINFEDDNDVYDLLNDIKHKKTLNFIINTEGGTSDGIDKIAYLIRTNGKKLNSYIFRYAHSAGSFLALASTTIHMDWCASLSPSDPVLDVDNEDESYSSRYFLKIKNSDDEAKLKSQYSYDMLNDERYMVDRMYKGEYKQIVLDNFLDTKATHDKFYTLMDLVDMGMQNISEEIPDYVSNAFKLYIEYGD